MKTKKKDLRRNLRPLAGTKFAGCFSPGWLFFLWSSSAQLSTGERLTLDGGMQNLNGGTPTLDGWTLLPASPLQFKYCLKVSYSCMPNMATIISSHNKYLLSKKQEPKTTILPCNCSDSANCSLNGECRKKAVMYKASITSGGTFKHLH